MSKASNKSLICSLSFELAGLSKYTTYLNYIEVAQHLDICHFTKTFT
ncbi:hypothetical protein M23134_05209 [Microscilla marina ATCC 23134]|uniref:Uncharacterized protein n=1 Tax=Microscilla marina ATCC 23134 TaxID=313606 RepID=A1ZDG4_MICM2|nr:hypothetical protein M23134_05209 [Microscilla marina ATCC 23134]